MGSFPAYGCSNANADVESFHSTVELEFFNLEAFASREEFFRKVQVYQYFYNFIRPNFSKAGKTPLQIVLEDRPNISPEVLNFPVYDLDALFRQKMELPTINGRGQYVPKLPGTVVIYRVFLHASGPQMVHGNYIKASFPF
jgi:hypothetical protein